MYKQVKTKILNHIDELPNHTGKTVGICSGCFDILQSGHAVFFEKCKNNVDILIVVVGCDKAIKKQKGINRPINPENNRIFLVASIEAVDYAILGEEELQFGKIDYVDIIRKIKPKYLFLNNDDNSIKEKNELCKAEGVQLEVFDRTVPESLSPTSTSTIIKQIRKC